MASYSHKQLVSEANDRATNNERYTYKCILGEGTYGRVLKATDNSTDEDVAVKIIKAKKSLFEKIMFFMTPASLTQGRKEALILTHLQHENITAIRDHFRIRLDFWFGNSNGILSRRKPSRTSRGACSPR